MGDEICNGSGYSDKNTLYTKSGCLEPDEYTFTITDAYGDGICCSYGSGGYVIKVDGTEVVSGGEFGDSETETFTVSASPTAPVSPPSPVTSPTGTTPHPTGKAPTPYPTDVPPTPHPTGKAPTPYPTEVPSTPHPTGKAPTPYPTEVPPTPHPTGKAPTPYPT